jgi:hypothetical protein
MNANIQRSSIYNAWLQFPLLHLHLNGSPFFFSISSECIPVPPRQRATHHHWAWSSSRCVSSVRHAIEHLITMCYCHHHSVIIFFYQSHLRPFVFVNQILYPSLIYSCVATVPSAPHANLAWSLEALTISLICRATIAKAPQRVALDRATGGLHLTPRRSRPSGWRAATSLYSVLLIGPHKIWTKFKDNSKHIL